MLYLWIKALHVIFVIAWFAGLFYLPRLFVYHAGTTDSLSDDRFQIMERRLYALMTLAGIVAVVMAGIPSSYNLLYSANTGCKPNCGWSPP